MNEVAKDLEIFFARKIQRADTVDTTMTMTLVSRSSVSALLFAVLSRSSLLHCHGFVAVRSSSSSRIRNQCLNSRPTSAVVRNGIIIAVRVGVTVAARARARARARTLTLTLPLPLPISLITSKRSMSSSASTETSNADSKTQKQLVVDPFCFRQFSEHADLGKGYTGSIFDISIAAFEEIVNERYREEDLKEGYAPFCKHLFVVNDFVESARVNVLRITPENESLLRTKYEARNDKELPVLIRYFPKELLALDANAPVLLLPKAKFLDLILYSREQICKENEAQEGASALALNDAAESSQSQLQQPPWGIVSIKAQDLGRELPMNPITSMRNALGETHGGSGVPLDRDAYMEAVSYWKDHAVVT